MSRGTRLGFLAAHTTTLELQLLVTVSPTASRPPGEIVSTLDILSGDARTGDRRSMVRARARGAGRTVPGAGERLARLEETLQIVRQMWSPDNGPFEGPTTLAETSTRRSRCAPRTDHDRCSGEKKTLRLVARYADQRTLRGAGLPSRQVKAKFDVLAAHCEREGTILDASSKRCSGRADQS